MKSLKIRGVISLCLCLCLLGVCFAWGQKESLKKPKQRTGFFFGTCFNVDYFDAEDLNLNLLRKKAKLGYTLKGGFIDSDHMGEAFLWTVYYQKKIYNELLQGDKSFKLEMSQPSLFNIKVNYPSNWDDEPNEVIAKQISIELGQYLAYTWTVYHEMLTWYGYKSTGIFSEFGSAFSPEDLYSDLLGTIIASDALKSDLSFDESRVSFLKDWLNKLEIQPKGIVKNAFNKTKKTWYNGKNYPFNKVYKRNFDIGLDGFISPCLIEGIGEELDSFSLPVPIIPCKDNFSISVKIQVKEKVGKKHLLKIVEKKKFLEPQIDFPQILGEIKKDSIKKLKK